MKSSYQMQGYTLHLMPTKKFKTINISLRLQSPLTKDNTTLRTLLTFVLIAATNKYPTTKDLASYLDDNYGARLSTNINTKGKSQVINVHTSFVNDVYLPNKENLTKNMLELLSDLFFDPYAKDGAFNEEIVELKKTELKARLQMDKDDKFTYSLDKLFDYMGKDCVLGIPNTGYEDKIDNITSNQLYQYFLDCINNDKKEVYVVGDIDESIIDLFNQYLKFPDNHMYYDSSYIYENHKDEVLEIIETQDITQSKLNMGYSIDVDFNSKYHYAFTVFNAIFGGFSQSRLFKVVREEHSLCYYVSSSYDAFNGIMIVNAGIEADDYEKTKTLIQEQLDDLKSGHIEEDEIDLAKMMLKNSLIKTRDEAGSMITLAYNRDIVGKKESNEEYIEKLMKVSKEDLIKVSQNIHLDTIFFLTGKEYYGNH